MQSEVKFVSDFSLGQVISLATILPILTGILYRLYRISKILTAFLIEHEILIGDYTERKNINPGDLPTRRARKEWP